MNRLNWKKISTFRHIAPLGLGRTGYWFAGEPYGIIPDMLVLGKDLGGGIFPLAALIARDKQDVASD
ncbi:MAG TPA: aminotransferase class III-fold pyridoxal phosphate-dependent enzyme [Clostridia bacterium]|nr:aminotransferase class III-fold pyridoxal phosphate-dependent enzyme [Clostridia bacterium]